MVSETSNTAPPSAESSPASSECLLTVLMPCLNEAETLQVCITKALGSIKRLGIEAEVLIADNGSTDGSQELARRAGARVVEIAEKGYGSALRGGISSAKGRWIIIGDADDSYDFSRLEPFLEKLEGGADLVMGCRMPWGGGSIDPGAMPWKHRWIGNPVLTMIGKIFFSAKTNDFHCGLRGFSREAYGRMELSTTGMEFASEMVIKASLKGMRIEEVPITLHKDGRSRAPHLRSWRDGWRHLRFMLLHCPRWLFLIPSLFLILFGVLFGATLSFGPLQINGVKFDTNTLLVCAFMVMVGLQLAYFGIFARRFATEEQVLPPSLWIEPFLHRITLEHGVFGGMLLTFTGFLLLFKALLDWQAVHFGDLSYPDSLRQVIPAVTLMTSGVQITFSSFFLGILELRRR